MIECEYGEVGNQEVTVMHLERSLRYKIGDDMHVEDLDFVS